MAGPWRARARVSDLDTGNSVELGRIGFPAVNYWPWVDEATLVVNDRRGRPIMVTAADPETTKPLPLRRWPGNIVGSGAGLGLAWTTPRNGPTEHAVFDSAGTTAGSLRFASWCAGFSRDGSLVSEVSAGGTEIWLTAWSPTTGQPVARQELTALDPRFERQCSISVDGLPDRRFTVANSGLWQGGPWRSPRVEIEPISRTFVVELLVPTGDVVTDHGKPCTEVTREWVHLAVDP